ncbi:MAG: ABC-F family ATP-binding cassette domain-containing protein [Planctomycetaceae bacterium]|jgi:ATP-binding cassette subfamily F protein 3|nr:ABC-F family ATP-binding cassette domain-containing protein [Planctomycetaceae bacterium]
MEVILTVEHLRKHFSADPVLVDVSFQLRAGDKIGLVGPNGCGKTTLLNILAGREESEKGSIDKASGTSIGYLEQRPETASHRTVLEEAKRALAPLLEMQHEAEHLANQLAQTTDETELIRLAARYDRIHESLQRHDAYHLDHRIEKILHGVGFADDELTKPVVALSGGEMNRLSLAQLLLEEPDIMLLDEPSNHLDLLATEWLENFLHDTSAAVILVSHDRYFLDRVTNRTLELYHGTIDDYPGNFSKYTALKEERLNVQTRTYEKYIEEVEKAKEFIRRNHYGMKAAQAEDRRKKLERIMETPADPPRKIESPPMHFNKPSRTGDIVFRCEELSKGFTPGKPLFRDLTFDIERGQRWAILGPNGCGKTTLLRCLLNEIAPDAGKTVHGQGLKIGYFDQQLHVLDDSMQVVDAIRPVTKKIFEEPARRNLLGAFGLTGDQQLQTVASLSGGQRCRAALAKLSAEDANVLILDEPTNHLDLWARAALEKAVRDFEGTVLFISHDRYFVDRVADHLLIIQPDARFKTLEGNYSTFRHMVSKGLMADPFLTDAFSDRKAAGGVGKAMVSTIRQNQRRNHQEPDALKTDAKQRETKQKEVKQKETEKQKTKTEKSPTAQPFSAVKKHKEPLRKEEHWKNQQGKTGETVPLDGTKPKKEKKVRKFPFRKIHEIEEEIFARETQIMAWNEDLLRPEIARDGERTKAIHLEIKEEQDKIALLYEHWEEASELNW